MNPVVTKACFFLLTVVVLTSCNNDKDPAPSIVGNWTISSQVYNLTSNGQSFKDYLTSKVKLSPTEAQTAIDNVTHDLTTHYNFIGAIFNFRSDNTYSSQITYDGNKHTKFGTWKQSADGKTLTLTNDLNSSDIITATITGASNTELQIDLPGGTDDNTMYIVKYTVSVTATKTGDGDMTPLPVMSRLDSLVGSWVIASYTETSGTFDPTGRAFIFEEDGTWLDRVSGQTFLGTWILGSDGRTLAINEIDGDGKPVGMQAKITSLTFSTLKLNFTGLNSKLSIVLSRAP